MILRYKGSRVPLRDFGILIPAAGNRADRILEALRTKPGIGPESEWLLGPDGSEVVRADLERVHDPEYVERLFGEGLEAALVAVYELVDENGEYHRYDPTIATRKLPEMFAGTLKGLAGTYQCGKEALNHRFCFYLGGGAHHGHYSFGHGFCVVNDSVIAIRKLQAESTIRTAWIIDVDAHKGDGTAALTEGDDSIITLSAHMAGGWPLDIPEYDAEGVRHPSYTPSDIDVPIESGEEDTYVPRLRNALTKLEGYPLPEVAFVLAGADPYERDGLPSTQGLRLTKEQMFERDTMIFEQLKRLGVAQAWLMAGGYGDHAWEPYPDFLAYALTHRR